MGEVCRKLREPCKRSLEPGQHVVESNRERVQLARPTGRRHAFAEMSRPDAFERMRHFSERTQSTLGDRDCDQSRGNHAARQHNDEQNAELSFDLFVARPVLRHLDGVSAAGGLFIYGD